MSEARITAIEERLRAALSPEHLAIEDESHLHAGHVGAASGGGHFRVHVVADAFEGRSRVQRHRMVYDAVGELMAGEIHALAVRAETPAEAEGDRR